MSTTFKSLRQFAVHIYAQDGVSTMCLELQDTYAVDVNMLLFTAWVAHEGGKALELRDIAAADERVKAWRSEVVQPLRAIRRRLKSGPAPAPDSASDSIRNRIKAAELEAELYQLDVLQQFAERWQGGKHDTGDPHRVERGLAACLEYFGGPQARAESSESLKAVLRALRAASASNV
ncbi:TIGR02444 family protein [Devosia sp. 1566]|uniref:TIGR02444 family protein n=1 Tax=Devosia sp. 1566 TaxID=2499144 RepID=UPI000FD81BED|nr:TIGR02444 family protein [Devosia sp. 1566]